MHALALCTIEFHPISVTPFFRLIQLLVADALNLSVSSASFINVLSLSVPGLLVLSSIAPKAPLSAFLQGKNFQSQQYLLQSDGYLVCGQPRSSLSSTQFNIFLVYTLALTFIESCWSSCSFAEEVKVVCIYFFYKWETIRLLQQDLASQIVFYSVSIFLNIFNFPFSLSLFQSFYTVQVRQKSL